MGATAAVSLLFPVILTVLAILGALIASSPASYEPHDDEE